MSLKMAKYQKTRPSGFTLIETVVVLSISILIISLSALELKPINERIDFENTVHLFKTNYYFAQKIGAIKQQGSTINLTTNSIRFRSNGVNFREVKFPSNMKIIGLNKFTTIPSTGFSGPKTIIFRKGNLKTTLKVQMMWGRIIEIRG